MSMSHSKVCFAAKQFFYMWDCLIYCKMSSILSYFPNTKCKNVFQYCCQPKISKIPLSGWWWSTSWKLLFCISSTLAQVAFLSSFLHFWSIFFLWWVLVPFLLGNFNCRPSSSHAPWTSTTPFIFQFHWRMMYIQYNLPFFSK